jgi:hypothetical protein
MELGPKLLDSLPPPSITPALRRDGLGRLTDLIQPHTGEFLEKSDEEERHFVVCELLAKADTWASIERKEDVRVRNEIFMKAVIEETHGIEFESCPNNICSKNKNKSSVSHTIWSP